MAFANALIGGWSPRNLRPQLWFTATKGITTDGSGNVSGWVDQAGSGASLQNTNAGQRPKYSATGFGTSKPCVDFSGGYHVLKLSFPSEAVNPVSCLMTLNAPSNTNQRILHLFYSSGSGTFYTHGIDTSHHFFVDSATPVPGTATADGAAKRLCSSFNGTNLSTWVNGAIDVNGSAMSPTSGTIDNWFLGANDIIGVQPFDGTLAEVILVQRAITAGEVAAYDAWARTQWA